MSEKRQDWITIAKSVALILVIFIHSLFYDILSVFLTGFVMPAFFILFGVTHNSKKYRHDLRNYLANRARALLIPYFVLSLLMLGMYAAFYPTVDLGFPPTDFIFWMIYGNGPMSSTGPRVSHLWFLRTMFFAIVLFSLVDRYLHDKPAIFRLVILVISPIIGVRLKYGTGVVLVPWSMDAILIALSFMLIGSEVRRRRHLLPWSVNPLVDVVGFVSALAVYTVFSLGNGYVNIGESGYGNSIIVYMFTGVLGTYIVCLLSYYADKKFPVIGRGATKFNKYGQEIYETHPLVIQLNYEVLGSMPIWAAIAIYPPSPLLLISFPLATILSYLWGSKVVSRSGYLQLMFLGFRRKDMTKPKLTVPVPEPDENDEAECVEDTITDK